MAYLYWIFSTWIIIMLIDQILEDHFCIFAHGLLFLINDIQNEN